MVQNLEGSWKITIDPQNIGKTERWFEQFPEAEALETIIPSTIQQSFPGYHGVAWYYREIRLSVTPILQGRLVLRFGAVDYFAEVWVNGAFVGQHESGETPFLLDVTLALKTEGLNRIAVRVINPANDPIDGFSLNTIPHRNKTVPYKIGYDFDFGGILQSVELITVPDPSITDVHLHADPQTGQVQFEISLQSNINVKIKALLSIAINAKTRGSSVAGFHKEIELLPGDTREVINIQILDPHLWSPEDPWLYQAAVWLDAHEKVVRFGFREFKIQDGYFCLNGHRRFLRSAHTGNDFPIGLHVPPTPDLAVRDMYLAKAMGFNMVRFIAGLAFPEQLDACDELGLMVYEEPLAAWMLGDSPQMAERFDRSIREMLLRDRNHPCVVLWGLLNENPNDPVFKQAVKTLALVRNLDRYRVVALNSGRWDKDLTLGSFSNPESEAWDCYLGKEDATIPPVPQGLPFGLVEGAGDVHYYPPYPLKIESIRFLRTLGHNSKHVYLSEHGCGSEIDVVRLVQLYEQLGAREDLEDLKYYKNIRNRFLADWDHLHLGEIFSTPAHFFRASHLVQAEHRRIAFTAIRSNPHLCGFSMTGLVDQGRSGEGSMCTTFREIKPLAVETISTGWAPLRWCIFVEPVHGYRGQSFNVEIVLANEDILRPGKYHARWKVVGPKGHVVVDHQVKVQIPEFRSGMLTPFVGPVVSEDVKIDGPAGTYVVAITLDGGAAPTAGSESFFISDPAKYRVPDKPITIWEEGTVLHDFLSGKGVKCNLFDPTKEPKQREILLLGKLNSASTTRGDWEEFIGRIYRGCVAIFLCPESLQRNMDMLYWVPLEMNGMVTKSATWAAGRDDYAQDHPIFDGMPCGGMLDTKYYRDLIPERTFDHQDPAPDEVVSGAIGAGYYVTQDKEGYYSGDHIAIFSFGEGRFVLNTFLIGEHIGKHPAADRLVLNFLRWAQDLNKGPLVALPPDFKTKFNNLYP